MMFVFISHVLQSLSVTLRCKCKCFFQILRQSNDWNDCMLDCSSVFTLSSPCVFFSSLRLSLCRQLCMKAKTRTQRCAECCWHTRSCAGEADCNTSFISSSLSFLVAVLPPSSHLFLCSSPAAAHFVHVQEVLTSHLTVLNTFLILSTSLTPPHIRIHTDPYLLRKMSFSYQSRCFNYNLKMNFFGSRLGRKEFYL